MSNRPSCGYCAFCSCFVEYSIDVLGILIYTMVQVFNFFFHCLFSFSIHYQRWSIESPNIIIELSSFYFNSVFSSCILILLLGTYMFIIVLLSYWVDIYDYKMFLFVFSNNFCLNFMILV